MRNRRRASALARSLTAAGVLAVALAACSGGGGSGAAPGAPDAGPPVVAVRPLRATEALPHDPDDPALWVNRAEPARSLVLATVKVAAPHGALAVFGMDGRLRQLIAGLDRPNNVDVEYGLSLGGVATDIAVLTERLGRRLRAYAIASDGSVRDVSSASLGVLQGGFLEGGAPMGIALYRRPADGAVFAIVAPKAGPRAGYLWQYRLEDDGAGRVKAGLVRRFGAFSGAGEIEAVAVDDELGYVYYADERAGIRKYRADPAATDSDKQLAFFGTSGYRGDREGLAIYTLPGGKGFVVSADQLPGESVFHLYRREGEAGDPHDHSKAVLSFKGGADATDGVEATSETLGPEFPDGLFVAMNSSARNFLLFRWRDVSAGIPSPP